MGAKRNKILFPTNHTYPHHCSERTADQTWWMGLGINIISNSFAFDITAQLSNFDRKC